MTETAKERIYREALEKTRDRLDSFEELYANKEVYYAFYELTRLVEKGLSQAYEIPVSTDKLSVEKLQEIRVEELKDFNSKILQAELKNQKLQEQLNTAKKYIEHAIGTIKHDGHLETIQTDWILPDLEKALAAIGNEGSGDE